jgi:hypothetical protein
MKDINKLLLELLEDAKQHNPNSEAVKTFQSLTDTMTLDIVSTITDNDSDIINSVYRNDSDPLEVFDIIDSLKECNLTKALNNGLSDMINLDYDIFANLSLNFSQKIPKLNINEEKTICFKFNKSDIHFTDDLSKQSVDNSFRKLLTLTPVLFSYIDSAGIVFDTDKEEQYWEHLNITITAEKMVIIDKFRQLSLNNKITLNLAQSKLLYSI